MSMYDERYGNQPEMQDISRQRAFAKLLQEQGMQQEQGQMVSGHYVAPSWSQHLAKALQSGMGAYMNNQADKQEKDYGMAKNKAFADILSGNKPQSIQDGTTQPMQAPERTFDQFGSPTQGQDLTPQPNGAAVPNMRNENSQEQMARVQPQVLDYMQKYGATPESQFMLAQLGKQDDRAYAKGEKVDDRTYADNREGTLHTRDRGEHVADVESEHKYQEIVTKANQGFQLTMQEKQFANAYKMQAQSQGFQAGQNALSRGASAEQGRLGRDQQLVLAGLKSGAGTQLQKTNDANDVLKILKQADPLVKTATSSGLGNIYDKSYAFFGGSSEGANDAAQLKALEGNLVSKMPKMSGPQSDKDVLMYKQMAGQIGDPTIPVEQKQAAMEAIREINSRYAGVPYEQQNIMPRGETMPNQDAGYAAWKAKNGK